MGKLKVDMLKPHRKAAQEKHRKNLDDYVKSTLGRPMETLAVRSCQ